MAVDYATNDYTAVAGSDYQAAAGTLYSLPARRARQYPCWLTAIWTKSLTRIFLVNVDNPTGAFLGSSRGWGTIGSDDPLLSMSGSTRLAIGRRIPAPCGSSSPYRSQLHRTNL